MEGDKGMMIKLIDGQKIIIKYLNEGLSRIHIKKIAIGLFL